MTRLGSLFLAVVFGLGIANLASAQQMSKEEKLKRARAAFDLGTRAYEAGEFPKALSYFKRAYRLTESPDLLYNIATVADRMRLDEDALEAYEGYIKARPKSVDREHVEGRIRVLKASIAEREATELQAEEEVRKAAEEAAAKVKAERPLTRWVGPGPGPWITIGVSSATLATGVVLFALGRRDINKVEGADEGSEFSEFSNEYDRGPVFSKTGIALMSVGAAGVLAGVIWQLTGGHEEKITEVSLSPTGISVRRKF